MKRAWAFLVIATITGSPVWAQQKIDQIVARVNGDIVLKSEVDRELDLRRIEMAQQGMDAARINQELAEQSKIVLRDLIDRALLLQIAKEAGLSADLDVQKTLEELRVERKFATLDDLEKAIKKDYGDFEEFKNDIRVKYLTQQVIEHEVYASSLRRRRCASITMSTPANSISRPASGSPKLPFWSTDAFPTRLRPSGRK